jgi:hypothetical protein
MWRVIYTDGRKHSSPDKLNPTYLGEGIGRWEGDTLVIDDIGFNTRSWLDAAGHEHTEQLGWSILFHPGMEPMEYICQENNVDIRHLVGK